MPMKKSFALVFALAFALVLSGVALAYPGGGTASQTVSFEVTPIHAIAVSGDPAPLVINTASAGSEPDDAIDSSTTYSFTTNYRGSVILASLDSDMPYGVTLSVELAVPTGYGVPEGYVPLSGSGQPVVFALDAGCWSGLAIGYKLHAPAEAGYNGSDSRTVTFTLMGEL
jgi:hypothetical protein